MIPFYAVKWELSGGFKEEEKRNSVCFFVDLKQFGVGVVVFVLY
jgi:hypothetical protein